MVSLRGLILIYRRVSPFHPGVNPHRFLFEISRREKSQPRWKQSYGSKASVLLYINELHIPFLLLNWVDVDMTIEHGWRELRTESDLQVHGNTAASVINSQRWVTGCPRNVQRQRPELFRKDLTHLASITYKSVAQVSSWMIEIGLDKTNLFYTNSSSN